MSLLLTVERADFVFLKEKTEATAGNLSVQIDKLSSAGYIAVEKVPVGVKTRTFCSMTDCGREAMRNYIESLKSYFVGL